MHRSIVSSRVQVNILEILLEKCYTTPACQKHISRRSYSTGPGPLSTNNEITDVAVLGGGITGLASAYYLTQQLPHARITLFESTSRVGGWLHSKQLDIGSGKVLFEQGPRSLRPSVPNGMVTLDLVCSVHCVTSTVLILETRSTTWGLKIKF